MHKADKDIGLITFKEDIIGLDLGHNFSPEHERIMSRSMIKNFGIDEEKYGFDSEKITKCPNKIYAGFFNNSKYLVYSNDIQDSCSKMVPKRDEVSMNLRYILLFNSLKLTNDSELATAWNAYAFGIHTANKDYFGVIDELVTAFDAKDLVIDLRSDISTGLGLLIYSKIPEKLKEEFLTRDHKYRD